MKPDLYVDADACPMLDEILRVADRYGLQVLLVANNHRRPPRHDRVRLVTVSDRLDAADDWIAEHIGPDDIALTADVPLAARCLDKGAAVIDFKGRPLSQASIGGRLATRNLMAHLREAGVATSGPAPLDRRDRSRFLSALDNAVQAVRRRVASRGGAGAPGG